MMYNYIIPVKLFEFSQFFLFKYDLSLLKKNSLIDINIFKNNFNIIIK